MTLLRRLAIKLLGADWFYLAPIAVWPLLSLAALWLLGRWFPLPAPGTLRPAPMWEIAGCALGLSVASGMICAWLAVAAERLAWKLRQSLLAQEGGKSGGQ